MNRETIAKIIEAHKEYMTIKDMAEEFNIPYHSIRDYCVAKGIKLLTAGEINARYIRDMAPYKTKEQMAKALGIGANYVGDIANKEGIELTYHKKILHETHLASRY